MSKKKKKNTQVKKEKIELNSEHTQQKKEIPEEIKVLFGKFYVFSFVYILFFLVLLPFVLAKFCHKVSIALLMFWLAAFYAYMVIDVNKKRKTFTSTIFVFLIYLVAISFSFSIIKIFF